MSCPLSLPLIHYPTSLLRLSQPLPTGLDVGVWLAGRKNKVERPTTYQRAIQLVGEKKRLQADQVNGERMSLDYWAVRQGTQEVSLL